MLYIMILDFIGAYMVILFVIAIFLAVACAAIAFSAAAAGNRSGTIIWLIAMVCFVTFAYFLYEVRH